MARCSSSTCLHYSSSLCHYSYGFRRHWYPYGYPIFSLTTACQNGTYHSRLFHQSFFCSFFFYCILKLQKYNNFDLTKVEPLFCFGLFKSSLLLPYIFQIISCIIKYGFRSTEVDKTFIHLWVLYYLSGSLTLDCRLVRLFIEPQP